MIHESARNSTARQILLVDLSAGEEQNRCAIVREQELLDTGEYQAQDMQSRLKTDNAQFVPWGLMEEPCQVKSTQVSKHTGYFFFLVVSSWKVIASVHTLVFKSQYS